ncbi:conserved hypothetical protein [Vibrio owensii]|uniref:Uncharacterized protein n=1 Tax=Vibrio owensii TaxID=696485 RepID=A0AAU9QFB9_9VIBR|nr:hypothetical protein [Vibrio owensii]GAK23559.1 hypothetical protein JCM19052_4196 [Vibrio sp. JCM 19052]CAH1543319.1 conserved hypothetical protein [Vibrio owensii]
MFESISKSVSSSIVPERDVDTHYRFGIATLSVLYFRETIMTLNQLNWLSVGVVLTMFILF